MIMKKLCVDVQSFLASSLQIDTYKRAVEELVYNSLDAKAISIAVRVDLEENKIQVIDNGHGVSEIDFDVLGQKYMTSKCVDLNTLKSLPNTHGFRGQSLSNIISISQMVKITSRSANSEDTGIKIFCNGKLRELTKSSTRPSVGTTVQITGLFYNLHLKNKTINALGELNDIKMFLKQLSLVHTNISLSLRDDSSNEIIFEVRKNRDVYETLKLLFDVERSDINEFKVEKNRYTVTAYIGKKDKEISKHHWVYLNKKYLNKSKIHKIINDNFLKTSKAANNGNVKYKVSNSQDINLLKYSIPFYTIIISCPYYDYNISEITRQTNIEFTNWQNITKLLEKLIKFYTDDGITKTLLKPKIINLSNKTEQGQINDTRDRVTKIVNKLLKSREKRLRVSQMQNGVTGKITKRKFRNRPISKRILPKNNTILESPKQHIIPENNIGNKVNLHRNIPKLNNNSHKISKKIHKNMDREVTNNSLIKEINNDSQPKDLKLKYNNTTKKLDGCNSLSLIINNKTINKQGKTKYSSQLPISIKSKEELVNKKKQIIQSPHLINPSYGTFVNQVPRFFCIGNKYKSNKYDFTNERIQRKNSINSSKYLSIRKRIEKVVVYDYIPHLLNPMPCNKQTQWNHNIKFNKKICISSHDLVKTILSNQYHKNHAKDNIRNTVTYNESLKAYQFSPSIKCSNQVSNNAFTSRLTFESHGYNKKNVAENINIHKYNVRRQFITKRSTDNFLHPSNKQTKEAFSNNEHKMRLKKVFYEKNHKLNPNKCFKVNVVNSNYIQESSYCIEFSKSSEKEIKKNSQQIIESPRFVSISRTVINSRLNTDKTESLNAAKMRTQNKSNSKVENTHIINNHNVPSLSVINIDGQRIEKEHQHYNSKYKLQSTYTISSNEFNNKEAEADCHLKELCDVNCVLDNEVESNKIHDSSDSLNICNTVIRKNSKADVRDELSFNKYNNNFNDSIFNFDISISNDSTAKCPYNIYNCIDVENAQKFQKLNTTNKTKNETHFEILEETEEDGRINAIHENVTIWAHTTKDTENNFYMKNRLNFIPKGMSQIFENCNTKSANEYRFENEYFQNTLYNNFANSVQMNSKIYEPIIEDITKINDIKIEKVNTKVHKENASLTFNGKSIEQAKVLGQIDCKFIAAVISAKSNFLRYLVLFDQHAVHERIRLEKNLSDYIYKNKWNSVKLENMLLKLSKDDILYLHNFKEKFAQFGLHWDVVNYNEVSINAIPEAILGKHPRQVQKIIKAVKDLLLEEINILKTQSGCISLHAKSIMDLVCNEACRYAIKFGDKLTLDDCVDLLRSLAKCKTPFQCAHGRPVMTVILDIVSADNIYEYKADISKIHAFHMKYKK